VIKIVLDSSAVLAMVLKEPGGERLQAVFREAFRGIEHEIAISSVNWCEVLTKLQQKPVFLTPEELAGILTGVELIPFDRAGAERAAQLGSVAPSVSLGDRACLALASARDATAWTTDKAWSRLKTGVRMEILR
jgi:ribonuclease VapC